MVARSVQFIDKGTLVPLVDDFVERASHVFTDENTTYNSLDIGYQHSSVCHTNGEYACGPVSTNAIESFWAYMKRVWAGTYHWWSRKHSQRYLDEIAGRFNLRGLPVLDRIRAEVLGMEGRLLRYRDPMKG